MKEIRIGIATVCLLFAALTACAQRKVIGEVRTILKNGKNVERAEELLKGLLKDSANQQNKRIYQLWLLSVHKQYEQANERMYLKQRQDTAAFFGLARRMFEVAERLDSLDMTPNKKGRVDLDYRKDNAMWLSVLRPNLFNGGTYYVRKQDYQKAFEYFEQYIDCARQPLFTGYALDSTDQRMPEAAYWATFCGYKLQSPLQTLRYRHVALRDTALMEYTLQYMAEARRWLKDDSLYMETLSEGFRKYPLSPYFFPRLMDYHNQRGDYERALCVVDSALSVCDSCDLYIYAKATTLFNLKRYDESIYLSDALIAHDAKMADAYYNAGSAYLNKALALDPLRDKKQLRKLYQKARSYMETYRQLAPGKQEKWGPVLYRVYLNLNMEKQFEEIDKILKK